MIMRILLATLMALGLAGFGTIAVVSLGHSRSAAVAAVEQPKPTTLLIAAAHPLRAGALIKPDDLTKIAVPVDAVPAGAVPDDVAARVGLVGAMVRRPLAANAPIAPDDLLRQGEHGFLAAVLRPGKRAVTVAVDAVSGSAGLIWPGDEIDLVLTQEIDTPTLARGRRVVAETVLYGARVIAIDQHLADGPAPGSAEARSARTVTLEVSTAEAEKVQVAARIGKLSLVVRSTNRGEEPAQTTSTGPTWASDVSSALDSPAPVAGPSVVHVFTGAADSKEFKF